VIYWMHRLDGTPIRQATPKEVETARDWHRWHNRIVIADDVARTFIEVRICEVQDPEQDPEYRYCRVHPDVGAYRASEGCDYCRGE
jgi:hypothetical protein